MQVKSSRRDTTTTTTFKGETGCMNPIISCKDHDRSKRDVYDICETNEGGEVQCFALSQISGIHQPFFCRQRCKSIVKHTNKQLSAKLMVFSAKPVD